MLLLSAGPDVFGKFGDWYIFFSILWLFLFIFFLTILFCFVLFLPVLFPHSFFCFVLFWCSSRIYHHDQKRSHEIKKKVIKPCLFHDSRKYAFWVLNLVLFLIPRHSNRLTSHPSGFFKITVNVLFTNYVIELNLESKRLY